MDDVVPTVFIIEDSKEVAAALSRLLTAVGYQVRSFESAERYLSHQDAAAPGCLLLDVCLPGLSGIELQQQLVGSQCGRPIIFMTGMGDIQTSVHAMKEGAIDFLTKPLDKERLFAAVEQALRNDSEQRFQRAIRSVIERRLQALTSRERQVLEHVICGRLNKQIAGALQIGEKTVKVHRARVMSKMEVRSIAELVQLCARVGIAKEATMGASAAAADFSTSQPSATIKRSLHSRASVQLSVPSM